MMYEDWMTGESEWRWDQRRVYNPFRKCEKSGKFLFLQKAYYGVEFIDYIPDREIWLSEKEYIYGAY
jgi:hypothetical protein